MDRDTRNAVVIIIAAVAVILAAFGGIYIGSGVSPPQTVVESQSMQHGVGSQIGIIDTGDMIVVKDPSKVDIRSYVEGYRDNFSSFGEYGNVIIYDRGGTQNPVIHRAILWLDFNESTRTWSAPSLEGYPSDMWSCSKGTGYEDMSGIFTMKGLGYQGNVNARIDLDALSQNYGYSGYLTMGDNNSGFDQMTSITGGLVKKEQIESVAWIEIPWLGTIKMAINGEMDVINQQVPNTVPCMVVTLFTFIFFLVGLNYLLNTFHYRKVRKELNTFRDAPTPSFPVENEKEE